MSCLRFAIVSLLLVLGLVSADAQLVNRVGFSKTVASSGGGSTTLLLDEAGLGSAAVAYSVRKLRSAYASSCLRVRRSSDNAEQDIGFVSNYLDTATMLAFVGANDGFVVTCYDQSGNTRDATQATASAQPKIVSSGSLITDAGGKAAIQFDGSNDQLEFTATSISGTAFTAFWVNSNPGAAYRVGLFADNLSGYASLSGGNWGCYNNTDVTSGSTITTASLCLLVSRAANDVDFYTNGGSVVNKTNGSGYVTRVGRIGGDGSQFTAEKMQETVLWPSTSPSVTTIRGNVNAFFIIY